MNGEAPTPISCLELNSNYGLMAYGNMAGLVIVDVVQNLCLLNMGTADLYGAAGEYHFCKPNDYDILTSQLSII